MNIFYHIILLFLISACAVQGPISGGPVDLTPPELTSIYPPNFSTNIISNEKIVLMFNEQIDPTSAHKAIKINNNIFNAKVKGKKIIIKPKTTWNPSSLIDIYIGRSLADYQGNFLVEPINIFYSLSDDMPSNKISGEIIDVLNIRRSLNPELHYMSNYKVGLYKKVDSEFVLIKQVESDINLGFKFGALDSGNYKLAAVQSNWNDDLIDIKTDFRSKRYAILRDEINFHLINSNAFASLFIASPIHQYEIQGINFINKYWVEYLVSPLNSPKLHSNMGIFNYGYHNFIDGRDISGEDVSLSLNLFNEFENYNTPDFNFIVPNVDDLEGPSIEHVFRYSLKNDSTKIYWKINFSEPVQCIKCDSIFYAIQDSSEVYLNSTPDKFFLNRDQFNDYVVTSYYIDIDTLALFNADNINIKKENIFDLSGNTLIDSIAFPARSFITERFGHYRSSFLFGGVGKDTRGITYSDNYKSTKSDYVGVDGFGGIYGSIEFPKDVKSVVVIVMNVESGFFEAQHLRNNDFFPDDTFGFDALPSGEYVLYCYENYEDTIEGYGLRSDRIYHYFGGKWDPFEESLRFSDVIGPIEVRTNWDIKDLTIKFQPSIN